MSLASLHGPQFDMRSPLGHHSVSSSISDLVGSPFDVTSDNVVSIEELRQHMGSCFSCGVSWTDEHVSLDCSECGGYALTRPCPVCDGRCGVKWQRDFTMSHAIAKARWQGVCSIYPERLPHLLNPLDLPLSIPLANGNGAAAATAGIGVGAAVNNDVLSASVNNATAAATTQLLLAQELCARLEQLQTSPRI